MTFLTKDRWNKHKEIEKNEIAYSTGRKYCIFMELEFRLA